MLRLDAVLERAAILVRKVEHDAVQVLAVDLVVFEARVAEGQIELALAEGRGALRQQRPEAVLRFDRHARLDIEVDAGEGRIEGKLPDRRSDRRIQQGEFFERVGREMGGVCGCKRPALRGERDAVAAVKVGDEVLQVFGVDIA
jgi:GAF domain-containing protein